MKMSGAPKLAMDFVANFVDYVGFASWDDGLIGFANEDGFEGPLMMNYLYQAGFIDKKVFAI